MGLNILRCVLITGVIILLSFSSCASGCIYDFTTNDDGEEICGRFCPLKDEEGNDVEDSDGNPVYDDPQEVSRVNCTYASGLTTSSTTSPTETATATPTTDSN